jgi:hypothetical protein
MIFLTILSCIIFSLTTYFFDNKVEAAEAIMQYRFYVMFMIFTGKMNAKNNMMFDIKHLLALPINKYEIILTKSFADAIQLLPIGLVFLYGFANAYPAYHILFVSLIFILALAFAHIIAFNKRVDFSRMQHSQASFKNSFLYFHKYLEMFLQIILGVFAIGLIMVVFEKKILLKEYSFFILLIVAIFLGANSSLKMLMDETRSYFVLKRDFFRIGWKVFVVGLPLILFDSLYKGEGVLKNYLALDDPFISRLKNKISEIDNITNKEFLLAIAQEDNIKLSEYYKDAENIPWNAEIMGSYAPHLAVSLGKVKILKQLVEYNPEILNMEGKYKKRTPLFSAVKRCRMKAIEYLISKKVNLSHIDNEGNSPLIIAAKNKCFGGVLLLSSHGADIAFKNKDKKDVFSYVTKRSGISYVLKKNHPSPEHRIKRDLANEKKD